MPQHMDLEKTLSKSEMIAVLKKLVTALEDDEHVQIINHQINLSKNAVFEIEFEEEDGQAELELEFKWNVTDEACQVDGEVVKSSLHPLGYYEIFQGKDEKWYFHLKAANHQIILVSQGYGAKASAEKGIDSVKKNAQESAFELKMSKAHQPYFVLKAHNGEIVGTSQMYKRKIGAQKGVKSVIANAGGEIRVKNKE